MKRKGKRKGRRRDGKKIKEKKETKEKIERISFYSYKSRVGNIIWRPFDFHKIPVYSFDSRPTGVKIDVASARPFGRSAKLRVTRRYDHLNARQSVLELDVM